MNSHILPESFFEPTTIHRTQFFVQRFNFVIKDGHTIKPGTPEQGTTEHGTPAERRNNGTPPEHGTPAERRNNTGITEHHRNNGTLPEQWKQRGTAEHYDRALAE